MSDNLLDMQDKINQIDITIKALKNQKKNLMNDIKKIKQQEEITNKIDKIINDHNDDERIYMDIYKRNYEDKYNEWLKTLE